LQRLRHLARQHGIPAARYAFVYINESPHAARTERRKGMLAAVLEDVEKMVLKDVPRPSPGSGEVIVRMKACGICRTDYCAYTGERTNWKPGQIVGH
jgi:hypothetical protein